MLSGNNPTGGAFLSLIFPSLSLKKRDTTLCRAIFLVTMLDAKELPRTDGWKLKC
jgi:hypothetical protein